MGQEAVFRHVENLMIDETIASRTIPLDAMHGVVNEPPQLLVQNGNCKESARVVILFFVRHCRGVRLHSKAWILCSIQKESSEVLAYGAKLSSVCVN